MVGHSKWSKVKHIKGPLDVNRGAAFSKLFKETTVAARLDGGDLSGNPRLRPVVEMAHAQNMPKDNIERAIEDTYYLITTPPERLDAVADASRAGGIDTSSQKHTYLPDHTVAVRDVATAAQVLDDHDDTQNVHSNRDLPEEILARLDA